MADTEFRSTKEKLNAVQEILNNGLEDMFQNNESFKRFLELMSRFPQYSINNLALIHAQKPDASMVQGFKQWKKLDRYVNKGEKGFYIFAPNFKNQKETLKDENGEPIKDENGKDKVKINKVLTGFVPVKVFDISQTGGKELPTAKDFIHDVKTGQKKMDYEKLYSLVKEAIQQNANVPVEDQTLTPYLQDNPSVKGYYSHANNSIVIRNDLSIEHKFKTLIHEFAHSQLHTKDSPFKDAPKGEKETHAESVAFCVSNYYGLDTSDYSIGYIAHWAGDLDKAKKGLNDVRNLVEGTVRSIDSIISKHQLELLSENVADEKTLSNTSEEKSVEPVGTEVINQVESSLEVSQDNKNIAPVNDYKSLFTNAVPQEYIENFTENMDMTTNENPPYFEILDKQTLSFVTGQFIKQSLESENYEFQVQGEKVLTGEDFETGDYLITNVLSNGTDLNIYTKDFDSQFFIEKEDNAYNISVYKADGTKEMVGKNDSFKEEQSLDVIKAQYDYMALEKTANQLQFMDTMMKRLDLVMDKNNRDQLSSAYDILDQKLFLEDKNTLDRRFPETSIPNDRNTVMLLTEYVRASPLTDSLEGIHSNIKSSSEKASQRLGMNSDIYNLMLTNAVNQIVDNTIAPKQPLLEQVGKDTIILTRESENTNDYLESLKSAENAIHQLGISEDFESKFQKQSNEKLDHLLETYQLNQPVTISDYKKVVARDEATSYKFNTTEGKSISIADNKGLFPYMIQTNQPVHLKDVLSKTSGVQNLSLPEREKNVSDVLNTLNKEDKKKESVIENDSTDLVR